MDPIELVGYQIDRIMSIELCLLLQGKLSVLQEASQRQLGRSMSYAAAKMLTERIKPGDVVMIGTGFVLANEKTCETDGPIGAASLARAIEMACGAVPVIVTEEMNIAAVSAACRGMGLNLQPSVESARGKNYAAHVMSFPLGESEARGLASKLLSTYSPIALISIERPGKNIKGVYHGFRGKDISATSAKFDYVYEMARQKGILTIGIGDVGNELGLGNIREAVLENVPYARECLCPCKGGTACSVSSDVVVMAAVSNWGGYGVAALLSALTENPDVLQSSILEKRAIRECVDAGAVDGETGCCEPSVDGISDELNAGIVELMEKTVRSGLGLRKMHL